MLKANKELNCTVTKYLVSICRRIFDCRKCGQDFCSTISRSWSAWVLWKHRLRIEFNYKVNTKPIWERRILSVFINPWMIHRAGLNLPANSSFHKFDTTMSSVVGFEMSGLAICVTMMDVPISVCFNTCVGMSDIHILFMLQLVTFSNRFWWITTCLYRFKRDHCQDILWERLHCISTIVAR